MHFSDAVAAFEIQLQANQRSGHTVRSYRRDIEMLPRGLANFIPGLGEGVGPPGGASGPGRTSDNTLSVTLVTLPRTLRLPVPWGIIPTGPKECAFECPMRK